LPTEEYPLKGGAYFDVLSFHSYPHIDGSLRNWSDELEDFVYQRHSDAAVKGVITKKVEFEDVLNKHGFGTEYPAKSFIITECNIPRVAFDEYIGSEEAQRNFIIKALVEVQKHGIHQFFIYNLADGTIQSDATNEFHLMGLYKNLSANSPYTQISNDIAIGYKTTSDLLYNAKYDPIQTDAMLLDENTGGGAFMHPDSSYTYVLWTKTSSDLSETVTNSYSFPPLIPTDTLKVKKWDYSQNPAVNEMASNTIQLTGCPVFVRAKKAIETGGGGNGNPGEEEGGDEVNDFSFSCYPNPFVDSTNIIFQIKEQRQISLAIYDYKGQLIQSFLSEEEMDAGVYQYEFSGLLPTGVYLCTLVVNGRSHTCKIVKIQED